MVPIVVEAGMRKQTACATDIVISKNWRSAILLKPKFAFRELVINQKLAFQDFLKVNIALWGLAQTKIWRFGISLKPKIGATKAKSQIRGVGDLLSGCRGQIWAKTESPTPVGDGPWTCRGIPYA